MLPMRTIVGSGRLYVVRYRPAPEKKNAVVAVQIVKILGANASPVNGSVLDSRDLTPTPALGKILQSPNQTAYWSQAFLDSVTVS